MSDVVRRSASSVRRALRSGREIGLLDVRPEDTFATGHPLFAASFPLDRIELHAFDRIPRRSAPLVVYGNTTEEASSALRRLGALGYTDVARLDGGLAGWSADGGELFVDVNVPSKAFGELVEATAHTPAIDAKELQALLDADADVVVVDARPFDEYHTMSIPSSVNIPGAELVGGVGRAIRSRDTLVVVNCAGRTRSIIGTQSLINSGVPNRVVALRNGTLGWTLAGFELEHGQERRLARDPRQPSGGAVGATRWLAKRAGAGHIDAGALSAMRDSGEQTVYQFDVRTPGEYVEAHPAGFRCAPGGQLVQETDWYAPVRGARIVVYSGDGVRAEMTASWLAQMGWPTFVLDDCGCALPIESGAWRPVLPPTPDVAWVTAADVERWHESGECHVIDVDSGPAYRRGHLPGSVWVMRTNLARPGTLRRLADRRHWVLTSSDGTLAAFAAGDVDVAVSAGAEPTPSASARAVSVLAGGTDGWVRSGRRLESGSGLELSAPIDVYRRPYVGAAVDAAAAQAYLDWEYGLVEQLHRDGTHRFAVLSLPDVVPS